ncbi:hypothetical protein [Oceanobacillus manasiensis]|uniref:hypothetical protein n=1 Tax=Oceanobacillus manasiensis TaxID=586413 RepID=UPI0005A70E5B|nr:hypothetical protein [Oceanobacillus manasiensis]
MRVILELIRIVFIFLFLGGVIWVILNHIYQVYGGIEEYRWIGGLGIYIAIFVLYRNSFQFSGWYKGKGRKKLPHRMTAVLVSASVLCILLPLPLKYILG